MKVFRIFFLVLSLTTLMISSCTPSCEEAAQQCYDRDGVFDYENCECIE